MNTKKSLLFLCLEEKLQEDVKSGNGFLINCRYAFYSWLIMAWLCSCNTPRKATMLNSEKNELFNVTVYVRKNNLLFTPNPFLFRIAQLYEVVNTMDDSNSPVIKVVYKNMSQNEYEQLCSRLNNCTAVLAIQKSD